MILGPAMLEFGMLPQVAVATSSFIIIFTGSSTATQFLILGKLSLTLSVTYWVIGFVSAIVGQILIGYVLKKYKKQSYVNFLLGLVIIVSAIAMVVVEVSALFGAKGGKVSSFSGICTVK